MGSRIAWQVMGKEETMFCLRGSGWTVGLSRSGEHVWSIDLGGDPGGMPSWWLGLKVGTRGGAGAWSHPRESNQEDIEAGGGKDTWKSF